MTQSLIEMVFYFSKAERELDHAVFVSACIGSAAFYRI